MLRCLRYLALMLIPAVIATGCVVPVSPGPNFAPPPPTVSPTQAVLTALQVVVKRFREGDQDRSLQSNDSVDIQAKDRVRVEEKGRGLLIFPDRLSVELVRDTQLEVSDVRLEPAGFVFLRLKQTFGHTRTELQSKANTRLELDTDYATITSIADNTEFMVCHAPGALTCMVTIKGEAEVAAQGKVVTVRGGEGTYIYPGRPPKDPVCADLNAVRTWLDMMRGTEAVGDLGSLVIGWPQQPCSGTSASAVSSPVAPSTEQPAEPLPPAEGMVKIEQGLYVVGNSTPDVNHMATQEINLPQFWIDQYLVTNAQYKAFVDGTRHAAPPEWVGGAYPAGRDQHPVEGLTWDDATAYCTWVHKRLPTEAEWEVAGRGPGQKPPLFPWGSDPTAGGKVDELSRVDTFPVGSVDFNKSPFGVFDMTGNVWQWVGALYAPAPEGLKILRGGRHGFLQDMAYRQPAAPDDERFTRVAGVRCAASGIAGE